MKELDVRARRAKGGGRDSRPLEWGGERLNVFLTELDVSQEGRRI